MRFARASVCRGGEALPRQAGGAALDLAKYAETLKGIRVAVSDSETANPLEPGGEWARREDALAIFTCLAR